MSFATEVAGVTRRLQLQLNVVRKSRAVMSEGSASRKERSRLKRNLDRCGSGVDGARAMVSLADEPAQCECLKHMNCSCVGTDSSRFKQ